MIDAEDARICLSAGEGAEGGAGAVLPPIVQASLFRQPDMAQLHDGLAREHEHAVYSRGTNPTVAALERTLARLERAEACKCTASGMGAISALLFGLLKSGDHVLFVNDVYGPTLELAQRLKDFGVTHTHLVDADVDAIETALRDETRLIYFESPGSMLFGLLPIRTICTLAKSRGILTAIDNTVATPLLQKPIELGVDLVVHSCSKYIGGHSDVVAGAVMGSAELIERIFYRGYMLLGSVLGPFDAWLLLRGLLTLPTRMERHARDALEIAHFCAGHDAIAEVYHPALATDDGGLFASQMRGHSGLFSVRLAEGGFARAKTVADRLVLFGKAVSWGGPESLVITGHKSEPVPDARLPAGLLRLSIGFEGTGPLIEDLENALR